MTLEDFKADFEATFTASQKAEVAWKARLLEVDAEDPASFDRARDSIQTLEVCRFTSSTMLEYYLSACDNREFDQPRRYELANPTNEQLLKRRDQYETGIRMMLAVEQMPDTIELVSEDKRFKFKGAIEFIEALEIAADSMRYAGVSL